MSGTDLPPLPDAPRVSVVVPARDAAGTLERAVRSALDQQLPDGWPRLEVVVAVAASSDATEQVARRLAAADDRVVVVAAAAPHTPAVLNAGIGASSGDVVARLDAHATPPAGYLARAVATLRSTRAANVGAVQRTVPVGPIGAAVATALDSPAGTGGVGYREAGGAPRVVDTAYLGVFRRAALDAVGGFDERLVRNQDAELNRRLAGVGTGVWLDPALVVDHVPRQSWRALAVQYRDYGRWRRATARLHPGSLAPRQLAPPAVLVALVASLVVGAAARRPVVPLGALAGYVGGLTVVAVRAARDARPRPRVGQVVRALATMHLAWGAGFLQGPPAGALDGPGPTPARAREGVR